MIEMSELKPRPPILDDDSVDDESDLMQEDDLLDRSKFGRRRKRRRGKRRRLTLAVLPTALTLGNGVCGLAAIAIAVSTESLDWTPESKLFAAGLLIFGGMLFDALDGSAARLTGQASRFGAELDSLCDAVTFGVAPAVIVWRISDVLLQRLTWGIGVLFALCVLIRLARFNVETPEDDDHEGFEGLPSPAAAGTIAAFAIAIPDLADFAVGEAYPEWIHSMAGVALDASHYVIPTLALVLAFLMVSRYEYPHVFAQLVRGRRAPHQIGQALFAVVGLFLLHWVALPVVFCYFAFMSPIRSLLQRNSTSVASSSSVEGG
ncbi:CDP-diacylglycerol--serine O-phosphatidyltransferase [Rhodopirellula bahusiensis]|uniref:CDP-diacylglycerol--serine O-phosphatidyltransferase n=1 Tax=Rhodopirellula bahusiensis TaxID=2014065 RepID=UPI00326401CC